jgi:hypothetical protein
MPNSEARIVPRQPGNTLGPLRLKAGEKSFSADVQDISIMGIGLIGNGEYPAGSAFLIEGGPKRWKLSEPLRAELRHATRRDDGQWLLGCAFSRLLTADDIEALG